MKHSGTTISRRGFVAGSAALASATVANAVPLGGREAARDARGQYVLHFAQPAATWPDGLPVGNGRLGAVVMGGVRTERLQLNEESIWDGEPNRDRINPKAAAAVPRMRELLFAGKVAEAEALATSDFLSLPRRMPCYQTLGDLHLEFGGAVPEAGAEGYRLELNLDEAVASTSFAHGGVRYRREVFSSAPDQVIVVRLTADQPGALDVRLRLDRPHSFQSTQPADDRLVMTGQALPVNDNPNLPVKEHQTGVRFVAVVQALPEGKTARVAPKGERPELHIAGADAVTLLIDCATSYRFPAHAGKASGVDADVLVGDPGAMQAAVDGHIAAARRRTYAELRARHVADHQRYFRRVHFDLGEDPQASVPTDVRIRAVKAGGEDIHLAPLYVQYGRYMLIGSSRPGTLAANLQGIWNESVDPPWGSKYTININTEMNYWFAEAANLSECHLPLFDLLEAMRPEARRCAQQIYGAAGSVAHHNTDAWGDANPIDGLGGGVWPMGASWLSLHGWTRFAYTGDRRFLLERAYPALRENALFLLDYMVRDGEGHLVTGPSCSPENAYIGADGKPHNLCMGPTMDHAITRAVFARLLMTADVLGSEPALRADAALLARVRDAWGHLPPYKIAPDGRLQEWAVDYKEREPGHRHISHLLGLFPEDQITPEATPELARAARAVIDKRLAAGGGSTGWSRAWIINCLARLGDGEACFASLHEMFRSSTRPNMFDVCGMKENSPFQIDGNLGAPNGIIEMLLQTQGHTPLEPGQMRPADAVTVRLLPALPRAWSKGTVRGLRGRGRVEVDLAWASGKLTEATLRCAAAQKLDVRVPEGTAVKRVTRAGKPVNVEAGPRGVMLSGSAGTVYTLHFS